MPTTPFKLSTSLTAFDESAGVSAYWTKVSTDTLVQQIKFRSSGPITTSPTARNYPAVSDVAADSHFMNGLFNCL
jgi:hypothetical protein